MIASNRIILVPANNQALVPWCNYDLVHRRTRQIVGRGGFTSTPDKDGDVQITYEIKLDHQGYGFATEVVEALINLAIEKGVRFVFASTPAVAKAAITVARKVGMEVVDDAWDKSHGEIWCFRFQCQKGIIPVGHVSLRLSA